MAPRAGLPGQAATEPVGHFCAAAPVHFYAAVDNHGYTLRRAKGKGASGFIAYKNEKAK